MAINHCRRKAEWYEKRASKKIKQFNWDFVEYMWAALASSEPTTADR